MPVTAPRPRRMASVSRLNRGLRRFRLQSSVACPLHLNEVTKNSELRISSTCPTM